MMFPLHKTTVDKLTKEMKEHGWESEVPIILFEDEILDGRHRYLASEKADVEPEYEDFQGNANEALHYVLKENLHRRHLSSQEKKIAFMAYRKEMKKLPQGVNQYTRATNTEEGPNGPSAQRDLAKTFGVGHRTVKRWDAEIEGRKSPAKSEKRQQGTDEKRQRAFAVYDRRREAGEKLTRDAIAEEAGVSGTIAQYVIGSREAEPASPLPELSMSAQQKLEAWQHKLEVDFEYRVQKGIRKWRDNMGISSLEKKIEELKKMLSWPQYAVMKKVEYNKIVKCLHPDSINNRTPDELAEAFHIFTRYKLKLINDKGEREEELRKLKGGLPRTVQEMFARKKKKSA